MDDEINVRSDEELWGDLLILEGESRTDTLSSLAISYSGTENSQFAVALAEEAREIFYKCGFKGTEIEFVWVWGAIAESKAYLELYDDAIEAGLKCHELCMQHLYPGYESIRWDLIKWYLSANRFVEARKQFEYLYERYKFASELDYSEYQYKEL